MAIYSAIATFALFVNFYKILKNNIYLFFSYFLFLVLFIGFRLNIGPDYILLENLNYEIYNNNIFFLNKDFFHKYLFNFVYIYNLDTSIIYFLYAFISFTLLFYFAFINLKNRWFILSFLTSYLILVTSINSSNQFLVLCVSIFLLDNYKNNFKFIFAFITLFIFMQFHISIILVLPILLFNYLYFINLKKIYLFLLFFLLSIIFLLIFNNIIYELIIKYSNLNAGSNLINYDYKGYIFRLFFITLIFSTSCILYLQNKTKRDLYLLLLIIVIYLSVILLSVISLFISDRLLLFFYPISLYLIINSKYNSKFVSYVKLSLLIILFLKFIIWSNFGNNIIYWQNYNNYIIELL